MTHFLSERDDLPPEIEMVEVVYPDASADLSEWIIKGEKLGKSTNLARQLAEFPSNELTPEIFCKRVEELGEMNHWQLEVLDQSALEKKKLKALLAVAQGSENLPYLVITGYRHPAAKKTVGLVGKGVTFDSGGISLKPAKNMEEMKYDMSGAATVLGALSAISQTALPVNVVAAMPMVENMLSGSAVRPGDIVTGYSGKTIEIINTDAEGRLIMADTLSYLERNYKPDFIIDLATLTGSIVATLGNVAAGIFGTDEQLMSGLREAGEIAGERVWPLPLWEDYHEMMKSKTADIRNVSRKSGAGAVTAGIFLQKFIDKTPWAHIDIAGTAYDMPKKSYRPEGATGFGVKLLWHWLNRFTQ
jgi:leucyl aminopeptidase